MRERKDIRGERHREVGAHDSHHGGCAHVMRVLHSSETKVFETRVSCSDETKISKGSVIRLLGDEEGSVGHVSSVGGCFSIFVGKIPPSVSKRWLYRVFEPFGSIVDIF